MSAAPDRQVAVASELLSRVFAAADVPLAFRLWDGSRVRVGAPGDSPFEVVFRSRSVFRRILRRPTPLRFGEAFVGGEVDIEGDFLSAMDAGTVIERMHVPLGTRFAVLVRSLAL